MIVKYDNNMDKYLHNEQEIIKKYGRLSKKIIINLSTLYSADNLSLVPDKPPTKRHKLSTGEWAISLSKNWRMKFKPIGGSELKEIKEIVITDIIDYH